MEALLAAAVARAEGAETARDGLLARVQGLEALVADMVDVEELEKAQAGGLITSTQPSTYVLVDLRYGGPTLWWTYRALTLNTSTQTYVVFDISPRLYPV